MFYMLHYRWYYPVHMSLWKYICVCLYKYYFPAKSLEKELGEIHFLHTTRLQADMYKVLQTSHWYFLTRWHFQTSSQYSVFSFFSPKHPIHYCALKFQGCFYTENIRAQRKYILILLWKTYYSSVKTSATATGQKNWSPWDAESFKGSYQVHWSLHHLSIWTLQEKWICFSFFDFI